MKMSHTKPIFKLVDGFPIPQHFSEENFRSSVNYKPRPDDIFIVTYPKCGTTWLQHIFMLILRHGQPLDSPEDMHDSSPFLDKKGAKSAETMKRPGAIKTHLPFHLAPWSPDNKYIYVARNPKDCCVSYYHHTSRIPSNFSGTFDEYFEKFLAGLVEFGDYFDHLLGWYTHRNDPNVLFITYEDLKEDFESNTLKIAAFIDDKKYAQPIREHPEIMANIKTYSSFDFIKEAHLQKEKEYKQEHESLETKSKFSDETSKSDEDNCRGHENKKRTMHAGHFRKGVVGDWKNYFSEEQTRRLKDKFTERTKGTDIESMWTKYM
ncbi:sulfotransferase ssu-1 isoform X2 [Parasteatoda tepidariorum]|uniref:sulfotransferase ssu-1 isoform X2 n=1 Tax=Parasteatoda tepidariorum TaxID=114398 RepID=UPI001C727774|nr:sulfotransferase ssu-1 isoform X2 [Parasteatoda tepidariorum]